MFRTWSRGIFLTLKVVVCAWEMVLARNYIYIHEEKQNINFSTEYCAQWITLLCDCTEVYFLHLNVIYKTSNHIICQQNGFRSDFSPPTIDVRIYTFPIFTYIKYYRSYIYTEVNLCFYYKIGWNTKNIRVIQVDVALNLKISQKFNGIWRTQKTHNKIIASQCCNRYLR